MLVEIIYQTLETFARKWAASPEKRARIDAEASEYIVNAVEVMKGGAEERNALSEFYNRKKMKIN